jgi:HD-GYP domain-containing protein (c-di-GMP phosphodiesterase class II)
MDATMERRDRLVRMSVDNLACGMYVAELDRPWLETPFSIQGFYIRSDADRSRLAQYCRYVLVDPRRYDDAAAAIIRSAESPSTHGRARERHRKATPTRPLRPHRSYEDSTGLREEFATAKTDLDRASNVVSGVFQRLRDGHVLDLRAMQHAIDPLIQSVLRNKDALAALVRIKKKDDYTYHHSISTAVWATILGRQLGMDRAALQTLALSCSLLDIGKVTLPRKLLVKPGKLTADETTLVRRHVADSVKIVMQSGDADNAVIEIVAGHHERHDGSGYPRGLAQGDIPLGARIAGIADSYDAMITARPYAAARSSYEAMQELARERDRRFQGELIEQLMQAIGMFPTGSLVELDTGEVAIVVAQNQTRRLKPQIVVILGRNKTPLAQLKAINLLDMEDARSGHPKLSIARELPPGAYGIDAEAYYL